MFYKSRVVLGYEGGDPAMIAALDHPFSSLFFCPLDTLRASR